MIIDHSRRFGGAVRAGLLAGTVFASVLVSGSPAGAQAVYDEATDLTVTETSDVAPLTPGVADQAHFSGSTWVAYHDGFAHVSSEVENTLTTHLIDRDGFYTSEDLDVGGPLGTVYLSAFSDDYAVVRESSFAPNPIPVGAFDRSTGAVTHLGSYQRESEGADISGAGEIAVSNDTGVPFWVRTDGTDLRLFQEDDNGVITYAAESPIVDDAGTVVVAVGRQTIEAGERDVLVIDRVDGDGSDELITLPCEADTCEYELGGVHVDGLFTNVYVGSFALDGGVGTERVSASYHRISSNTVDSMPVSAISPNGRFLVGNSQVADEPEPSKTKLVVLDTETGRERLISIQGLVHGQTVFPLSVSDDGTFVQYKAYKPCLTVCLISPGYTGWFELEPTAPVTNGPAADQVQRLYRAVFGRIPDDGGFEFWMDRYRNGESLLDIAAAFAVSPEFVDRFGADPTDLELIDGLYQNVLGREGEAGGVAFWLASREAGMSVAELLVSFADSSENIERTGTRDPITVVEGRVLRLYRAVFGRDPEDAGMTFWVGEYEGGQTLEQIAERFMDSPEFTTRYGDMPSGISLINALYINVLGRNGDAGGVDFWSGQLDAGTTIPELLVAFADSEENVVNTGTVR